MLFTRHPSRQSTGTLCAPDHSHGVQWNKPHIFCVPLQCDP